MKKIFNLILLVYLIVFSSCKITSKECLKHIVGSEDYIKIRCVPGPEDFEYLKKENLLIVSSLDRRRINATGNLYMIDLSNPTLKQKAIMLPSEYPSNFYPLGITSIRTNDKVLIYVISKGEKKHSNNSIEIFEIFKKDSIVKCNFVKTLTNDKLLSPNDLVALPDGKLFIANDFEKLGSDFSMLIDIVCKRKRAPVLYYDGEKFYETNVKNTFTSGIAYLKNNNNDYLFCSDFFNNSIQKFKINWNEANLPTLQLDTTIYIGSGPDNLTIDTNNNLYAAAHCSLRLMLKHETDSITKSPTQIFKITFDGKISTIYSNNGDEISTGTVALIRKNKLFIGQLCEDFVFSCPIKSD